MSDSRSTEPVPADEARRIRRIARRLWPLDPIRQATEAVLDGTTAPPDAVRTLCAAAESPGGRWIRRYLAVWALGYSRPDERDGIGLALMAPAARHGYVSCAGCAAAALVPTLGIPWLPWALWQDHRAAELRAAAIRSLGRIGYVPAIPLAAALVGAGGETSIAVREALPGMLAAVTEDDYGRLPGEVTPAICGLLDQDWLGPPVWLPAVEALGRAGDGRAAAPIRRIAERDWPDAVRAAAWRVLPKLEERWRQERDRSLLLRATDAPAADSALLRAAGAADEPNQELLLRPAPEAVE